MSPHNKSIPRAVLAALLTTMFPIACLADFKQGEKLPDLSNSMWDPLWEVCSALEMSVNFHIGGSELSMSWFGDQGWPSLPAEERAA